MENLPVKPQSAGPNTRSSRGARSKYTTEACQECRRRRAKCDGVKPSCARCVRRSLQCTFSGRDDGRGTAPKSLVLLLQSRIELLEQVLWLHSVDVDASIARLCDGETTVSGSNGRGTISQDPSPSLHLPPQHHTDSDGALCSNGSFGMESDGEVRYFGSSSGRIQLLQANGLNSNNQCDPSPGPSVRSRLNEFCQEMESTLSISDGLKEHLIALYFAWEQPWCQLVDEGLFRESMASKGRYCSPLLLNCILAIGSRYSDRPEVRSNADDPNTAGQMFLEIAEVLLHFDLQSPSITTIQALGILGMMYVATGSDSKGWLRHGMAIRLALDMGLNLGTSQFGRSRALPDVEAWLRRQIYWALYCTDKMWASYTGRVCTMLDSQASVELQLSPKPVCAASSDGKERLPMLAHALSTHCQILGKIMMNLYGPKRLLPGALKETFFDSCLLELKSWKYRLPVELQIRSPATITTDWSNNAEMMPQVYILHMVYHTSIIMLAKPNLLPGSPATELNQRNSTAEKAGALCMQASKDICALGEQYRRAFGSFRRSPITATHCILSAVLSLISSLQHFRRSGKEDEARSRTMVRLIDSCITTLGELAESWMPAQHYWVAVLGIVNDGHHVRPSSRPTSSNSPPAIFGGSRTYEDHGSFWNADALADGGIWNTHMQKDTPFDYNFAGQGIEGVNALFDGLPFDFPLSLDWNLFSESLSTAS